MPSAGEGGLALSPASSCRRSGTLPICWAKRRDVSTSAARSPVVVGLTGAFCVVTGGTGGSADRLVPSAATVPSPVFGGWPGGNAAGGGVSRDAALTTGADGAAGTGASLSCVAAGLTASAAPTRADPLAGCCVLASGGLSGALPSATVRSEVFGKSVRTAGMPYSESRVKLLGGWAGGGVVEGAVSSGGALAAPVDGGGAAVGDPSALVSAARDASAVSTRTGSGVGGREPVSCGVSHVLIVLAFLSMPVGKSVSTVETGRSSAPETACGG